MKRKKKIGKNEKKKKMKKMKRKKERKKNEKKNACLPVAALLKPPQVGGSGKNWVFEIFLARIDTVEYKGSLTKGPCPLLKFLSLCCLETILCTINIDPLHGTLKKTAAKN